MSSMLHAGYLDGFGVVFDEVYLHHQDGGDPADQDLAQDLP